MNKPASASFSMLYSPLTAAALFAAPVSAEVTPLETVAGYKIAFVDAADVCLAVANVKSEKGLDMAYTYYRSRAGQRWQVAGYISALSHRAPSDELTIDFDGEETLTREVEFRDGDFMVPFQSMDELQSFEASVEASETLTFKLKEDAFSLTLANLRDAIKSVVRCAEAERE